MKPFDDQGDLFDLPRRDHQLNRRKFLQGVAALGASAGLGLIVPSGALAATQPKRGGLLKLGMGGGNTTDSIDPTLLPDWVPLNQAYMLMNGLVEIDAKMHVQPELLESWEAKPGAAEWILKVRKGVLFHNGKTLDADDVIYSINQHRGDASKSAIKSSLADVTEITKIDPLQISMKLKSGNADLPYLLSDYHLLVVPNGFKDWSHPIGTGPLYSASSRRAYARCSSAIRTTGSPMPRMWMQ